MFRWLRRREGKRIVTVSNERAARIDPIEELLRIVGENPAQPPQFPTAKKAQPRRLPPAPRPVACGFFPTF